MSQITFLAQVIQLLPRDSFKKLVRKPIESFYVNVLHGFARLDILVFYPLAFTPYFEILKSEFRSIVRFELTDDHQAVANIIHTPAIFDTLLLYQWLFYSGRKPAVASAFLIKI